MQPGKPAEGRSEVRSQVSRSEPSSEDGSHQAGERGEQQGRQRRGQSRAWGLGLEHQALPPRLQGPDVVCHFLFLFVVIVQLLRESKNLWRDTAQQEGQAGRAGLPAVCGYLASLSPW